MYENQNKHYAINVFSEHNVWDVIFGILFTHLGKGRGNPNWFPFGHVRFITETSPTHFVHNIPAKTVIKIQAIHARLLSFKKVQ